MVAVPVQLRSERTLRTRAERGDATAFATVYERHHQALYRYCRSILHHDHDAQDALQSTMTRAFAALQDERRDIDLRPWLFRIAHNEAITIVRRRKASEELTDIPDAGDLDDRIANREELRNLRLDLADLPERQRAALVLRELNGLSHAEIGAVLELSPSAVKQSIFEARTALFSCREGRDIACGDIQKMLSDGDGRVLRGRGVRAHLRACPDCRAFRAELDQRPKALRALAPPLPVGGAAALLAQLLVGGGTAAKLLACVALVGGGSTLAAEMHLAREPGRPAEAAAATPRPVKRVQPAAGVVVVAPATASARGESASATKARREAARERGETRLAAAKARRAAERERAETRREAAKVRREAARERGEARREAKARHEAAKAHREAAKARGNAAKPQLPATAAKPLKAQQPAKAQKQVKAEVRKAVAKVQQQVAKAEKQVANAEKQVAKAERQVEKAEAKQPSEAKPNKK